MFAVASVADVMRTRRASSPLRQWVCCFTCNVPVFHFIERLAAADVARFVRFSGAAEADGTPEVVVVPLRSAQTEGAGWVSANGVAVWVVRRDRLAIVSPIDPSRFLGLCLRGNKIMGWLLRVRARILSEQAYISTLGGGFASVRNIPKAIEYAVKLFYCACLLGDEDMKDAPHTGDKRQSKSRLFVGWSMLWLGNKKRARAIFLAEIEDCRKRHHEVGVQRGYGAMHQLQWNPAHGDRGDVVPDPSLQWHQVFSDVDQTHHITHDAHNSAYEISELRRVPASSPHPA